MLFAVPPSITSTGVFTQSFCPSLLTSAHAVDVPLHAPPNLILPTSTVLQLVFARSRSLETP